jgi:hypothetical protein
MVGLHSNHRSRVHRSHKQWRFSVTAVTDYPRSLPSATFRGFVAFTMLTCCAITPKSALGNPVPQQCSAIPQNRDAAASEFDRAWMLKRDAIADQIHDLDRYRQELDSDFSKWIGTPASKRELATMLSMVAKTTTDLIQDLADLAGPIESAPLKILKSTAEIVEVAKGFKDKPDFDFGSEEIDPVKIVLTAFKDLTTNTIDIVKLQDDLSESRKVYSEQMERLEAQLHAALKRFDDLERAHRDPAIDRLFARYRMIQRSCEVLADNCELESFNSCPEHPTSETLKCQDEKLHAWYGCLAEKKARERGVTGPELR